MTMSVSCTNYKHKNLDTNLFILKKGVGSAHSHLDVAVTFLGDEGGVQEVDDLGELEEGLHV